MRRQRRVPARLRIRCWARLRRLLNHPAIVVLPPGKASL
jgi:hypothetical protein